MRDYLTALLEFVRGEIKAGKPKDVIVKITDPLKGFPDHGPLIERVLTPAYEEVDRLTGYFAQSPVRRAFMVSFVGSPSVVPSTVSV